MVYKFHAADIGPCETLRDCFKEIYHLRVFAGAIGEILPASSSEMPARQVLQEVRWRR
jgi:hypothetical protein